MSSDTLLDNNGFTLPLTYKPHPDLIGKIILSDQRVMNAMTQFLVYAPQDAYQVASTAFMRSPANCVLYTAKNPESLYPPIIINIAEKIDTEFVQQVIYLCTEIYTRYEHLALCIMVGTEEIDQIVMNSTMNHNIPFARETRCDFWATECLLVSKDAMLNHDDPRHPLIEILNGIIKYNSVVLSNDSLKEEPLAE
ncbi:hypothetical protein FB192DRAFT_1347227 [Mucor lusitanicus]|uniref:Uncharacterized protein n=2 Tax=Mucor circinelloides f. lusitanicus TaxID=29924 RepID=A0A168HUJ3_MUCCL|nr:hypothetical protein FB192DRAFT_1347227 [Mucor lusitanicus]OAC99203.1 hypothetical protein MUCCIDRAFT_84149 [Mucor lusitanicus CBS 277.49]